MRNESNVRDAHDLCHTIEYDEDRRGVEGVENQLRYLDGGVEYARFNEHGNNLIRKSSSAP